MSKSVDFVLDIETLGIKPGAPILSIGAIGILRKAKVVTDRDIVSLRDRGDLSSPRVFTFK